MSRPESYWPMTPCGWLAGLDLPASCFRVLLALHQHADQNGRAWPSYERLADVAGLHRRRVAEALDRLRVEGVIERTDEYRHRARVWRIRFDESSGFQDGSTRAGVVRKTGLVADESSGFPHTSSPENRTRTYQEQSQDHGTDPYESSETTLVEQGLDDPEESSSRNGHDQARLDQARLVADHGPALDHLAIHAPDLLEVAWEAACRRHHAGERGTPLRLLVKELGWECG